MNDFLKYIFNKNMMFSVEQDESGHDVQVNLLERVKQKRNELKALNDEKS